MAAKIREGIMVNLLKHELLSRRTAILGWGIGLALFGSMYIAIYPEFSDAMDDLAGLSIYEAMGIDMTSFAGYMASVTVQYVPLLLAIYAIIASTGTLAGEEDQGTLELIVAMPLKRWQIVSVKAFTLSVAALGIMKSSVETDVTNGQLFVAVLNSYPITLSVMMMGLFFGTYLPSRRIAAIAITLIFVASYFVRMLASLVDSLDFIKPLSLFHYFDTTPTVFTEGVKASDVAVLMGLAGIFFVLSLFAFQRRNITVGAWPWVRSQVGK
jgi:ABC-2 type transport system permease protein